MASFLLVLTSMTLNGFEPPKEGVLVIFLRFPAATHILRVNCAEMAEDAPNNFRHFLAENVHF